LSIYLLQPSYTNNPAVLTTHGTTATVTDARETVEVAPDFWLGYIGDGGFGARIRYYFFEQYNGQTVNAPKSTVTLGGGPLASFGTVGAGTGQLVDGLHLQVWDLEALQDIHSGCWDLLFSGGLRLADLSQVFAGFATGGGFLDSGNSFTGIGPTVALEARRSINGSGLALYGTVRAAALYGSAKEGAFLPGGVGVVERRDETLGVGELELGVEYSQCTGIGHAFAQVGIVGQDWLGAGSQVDLSGPSGGDLGFFGVVFRIGLNY
jgi:Legionella pneumophila major outer membrane protein precursor